MINTWLLFWRSLLVVSSQPRSLDDVLLGCSRPAPDVCHISDWFLFVLCCLARFDGPTSVWGCDYCKILRKPDNEGAKWKSAILFFTHTHSRPSHFLKKKQTCTFCWFLDLVYTQDFDWGRCFMHFCLIFFLLHMKSPQVSLSYLLPLYCWWTQRCLSGCHPFGFHHMCLRSDSSGTLGESF